MSEQRPWRPVLAISGLLGLVGLVAFAAAARSPGGGEGRPTGHAPTLLADYLSTLALLLVPAGAILTVWAAFSRRQQAAAGTGKRGRSALLSFMFLVVAIGVATAVRGQLHWHATFHKRSAPRSTITAQKEPGKLDKSKPTAQYRARFRWLPLLVLGSIVVAFGGTTGVMVWRRRHGLLPEGPTAAELSAVLTETLDDLRSEPDPRRAVIGAYVKMERTFAARGLPREPFEAPLEYLGRILDSVQASSHSVRRLTKLFERARFSPHQIDVRMKEDAIEALTGLRAEMEAAR